MRDRLFTCLHLSDWPCHTRIILPNHEGFTEALRRRAQRYGNLLMMSNPGSVGPYGSEELFQNLGGMACKRRNAKRSTNLE